VIGLEMAALGRSRAMISLRGSIFWTIDNNIAIYDYVSPCTFCLPFPIATKETGHERNHSHHRNLIRLWQGNG
jgi:hypothetical protein